MRRDIVLLLILALPLPASAQPQPTIDSTWAQFRSALQEGSPERLARITRFPLESNDFGGPIGTAALLKARFNRIFTPRMRQCLLSQTPAPQSANGRRFYEAFCDADHDPIRFVFELVEGRYRWTALDNINE